MIINKEMIKKVADNVMINVREDELIYYEQSLNELYEDIKKIKQLVSEDEITFTPSKQINCFDEDKVKNTIKKEEILVNTPNREGDYILVPRVIK